MMVFEVFYDLLDSEVTYDGIIKNRVHFLWSPLAPWHFPMPRQHGTVCTKALWLDAGTGASRGVSSE